jgi:hypothetical protein
MSNLHEPSVAGLSHPEWVNGRRLWMDTAMRDLIGRIRFGDPVKGWEGDERLAIYWCQPDERWELWRLEDDGVHRFVCRSAPGVPFDERVIDALLGWDRQRRTRPLHDEIVAHNDRLDAQRDAAQFDWMSEEIAPRLRHAIGKEL